MDKKEEEMKFGKLLAVATVLAMGAVSANASSVTTYDANLVVPGFYNGTGNPNGGFTVTTTTDTGIELGLRAKYRYNGAVINSPDNTYSVVAGHGTLATSGNNHAATTAAAWNYEFSINLGSSGYTLSDVVAELAVTDANANGGLGQTVTVNALTHWTDDATFGNVGAQNSENLSFGDSPLAGIFDLNAIDTYTFTLTVKDANTGGLLASDTIVVNTTPLPTPALSGLLLLGAVGGYLKLKRNAVVC